MALTDNENGSMFTMPVSPMYGNGGNSGFGFGNDLSWLILLLLCGWGGGFGFGGGFGGMGGFAADGAALYPWMNQAEITTDGFRDQMLNNNVTSIRDSIGNLSTQLCNCCGDMQMALATGFAGVEAGANARQMADMNRSFALQSQLADCCCENRLGTADLKYTIATENCADRAAISDGIRDVIANQTAGVQRILDQLCADKIDAKNDEIAQLRQELLYSRGQASQVVQSSAIINGIYDRLNQCPVGTVPVYGEQPIFTCNNNCGCGCGSNF